MREVGEVLVHATSDYEAAEDMLEAVVLRIMETHPLMALGMRAMMMDDTNGLHFLIQADRSVSWSGQEFDTAKAAIRSQFSRWDSIGFRAALDDGSAVMFMAFGPWQEGDKDTASVVCLTDCRRERVLKGKRWRRA